MSDNLYTASQQWATRPNDQRFLSLEELRQHVSQRRQESWTTEVALEDIRVQTDAADVGDLVFSVQRQATGQEVLLRPSNWSFGQVCSAISSPASYLRKLPGALAAINMQWGLENFAQRDNGLILAHQNGESRLTSLTSTTYGRIWDEQVVDAVIKVNSEGNWKVPSASYASRDPKRATTLYASDRDVFIFLVDESRPIERGDESLFRGVMLWNSEVGRSTFGLCTFLYRYVCDNRIIWGATDVNELKIRHTAGAPDRFAVEGRKLLERYSNESSLVIEGQIAAAQNKSVGKDNKAVSNWLRDRGFTKAVADASVSKAEEEEGGAGSLWNIIQGVTAVARGVDYADDRVDLERKAGNLMSFVTGN